MGPEIGWDGVFGNLQGRANGVNQVDGVSDIAQITSSVALGGGFRRGTMASAQLEPDTSVSPCT